MFNLQHYEYFEDINLGLLKIIPQNKIILDVGCGSGLLGYYYSKKNNTIYGLDNAPAINKIASKRLNKFNLVDITDFDKVARLLNGKRFDIIVFADVLEHLYDPVSVMKFYKKYLSKNGSFYISLPNIAVWYIRLNLLFGNFKYTETGTLDKTHIRFFTRKNISLLARHCDFTIANIDITPGVFRFFVPYMKRFMKKGGSLKKRDTLLDSGIYKFYKRSIYPLEYLICRMFPGLLAFQYIVILKKKGQLPLDPK